MTARQVRLLHEALRNLPQESFDAIVVLDEVLARRVTVETVGGVSPT